MLLLGFERELGGGFNLPSERNSRGLDPNVAALINALIRINLGINHVEKELNYVKPTKFEGIEVEDLNK